MELVHQTVEAGTNADAQRELDIGDQMLAARPCGPGCVRIILKDGKYVSKLFILRGQH